LVTIPESGSNPVKGRRQPPFYFDPLSNKRITGLLEHEFERGKGRVSKFFLKKDKFRL
jgi:hypothetical protein